MRTLPCLVLPVSLALAGLLPTHAAAQWRVRAGAPLAHVHRVAAAPAPQVNYERRAAILTGVRRGALTGMVVGAITGVVAAVIAGDDVGGAFLVLGGSFGGLAVGGVTGGVVAARRYDRRQRPPPNVSLHLTGRPRTAQSSGDPLSIRASFRLHGARR